MNRVMKQKLRAVSWHEEHDRTEVNPEGQKVACEGEMEAE